MSLDISSILDVGCGTGILVNELKNMNFDVSGIDISKDMIDIAKEITKGIEFFVSDMKNFKLNKEFDMITREFDGIKFKQVLEYDRKNQIGTTIFDFGKEGIETHIQRAYSVEDMNKYLLNSGFHIVGRYKNFKMAPIEDRTYKVFYVAIKK
nr:class I SAM-dependent methyltransferase [Clostridium sp. D53t1_180928_C8]